ncbi:20152_t:CDS:2 [Gigaspora margarita]|uniref:20152_t:CDS:1 n=1 Tax=Gigaspora margarita TaxID=4874 RepID=A0ABN7U4F4_GIGMA|nr:20152_t:CDS:2 [Gigaspora margarita]
MQESTQITKDSENLLRLQWQENSNICITCKKFYTGWLWCQSCESEKFKQKFSSWTSGNPTIDKFIQNIQLNSERRAKVLNWIPYNEFSNIKKIAVGGFGTVFSAKWNNVNEHGKDLYNQQNMSPRYLSHQLYLAQRLESKERLQRIYAFKILNNSSEVDWEYLKEIKSHINCVSQSVVQCYGITQDPETKNYGIVMEYAEFGFVHRDFHSGNILLFKKPMLHSFQKNFQDVIPKIADLGLSVPVDNIKGNEGNIYKEFIESEKIRENYANLDQNVQDENVGAIYASRPLSQYITRAFEIDTNF